MLRSINFSVIPDLIGRYASLQDFDPEKTGRVWIPDQVGNDVATDTRPEGNFESRGIYPNRKNKLCIFASSRLCVKIYLAFRITAKNVSSKEKTGATINTSAQNICARYTGLRSI